MPRVRVSLRVRNEEMIEARARLGLSQQRLADAAGVQLIAVAALERFDFSSPASRDRAAKVAIVLEIDPELVAPADLIGHRIPADVSRVESMPSDRLIGLSEGTRELAAPGSIVELGELKEDIRAALARYAGSASSSHGPEESRKREALAIELRFGLGDREAMTLREVGKELGVSVERARGILEQGLEGLRHPVFSALLEEHTEGAADA